MTDLIAKLLMGGGVLALIFSFYQRYTSALQQVAQAEAAKKVDKDLKDIADKAKVSDEKVIDFNDAAASFERNNPPGKG